MRRTLTAAAALSGLALALSACGGSGGDSDSSGGSGSSGGGTLLVWADNSANTAKAIEPLCQAWAKQNGVSCKIQKFNGGQALNDALTKGNGTGDVPDIFEGPHNEIGDKVDNGLIAPVDLSSVQDKFNPKAVQSVTYNGNTYAVPWAVENIAMLTNTALAPQCPATLDAAVANAKSLISSGKVSSGLGIAVQIGEQGDAYHWYPLYSADGGFSYAFKSDGTANPSALGVTTSDSEKAGARLQTLAKDGMVKGSVNFDIAKAAFTEGKAAYWITGPWASPDAQKGIGDKLKVCPVPNWAGSSAQSKPFLGIRAFFTSAKAPNKTLASSFLQYVETTGFQDGMGKIDPRPSAWTESYNKQAQDALIKGFGDYGKDGTPMPNIPQMNNWFTDMGLAEYKIVGGANVQNSLSQADASIKKANAALG